MINNFSFEGLLTEKFCFKCRCQFKNDYQIRKKVNAKQQCFDKKNIKHFLTCNFLRKNVKAFLLEITGKPKLGEEKGSHEEGCGFSNK
jgi:hypothetical protein